MSDNSAVDLEAQPAPAVSAPTAHLLEYNNSEEPKPALSEKPQVSQTKKYTALAIYFAINLSLSTFNKQVLGQFAYPWILTALHSTATSIGCAVLLQTGFFKLTKLTRRENIILALFSTLFTINIAISNVSLSMVSMPFHQIMRSTCPVFTVLIYRVVYSQRYETAVYLSLIPMVLGIGMVTYGDYYFTARGFILTALGVVLASIKTIATNRLMTGNLKLPPLEILLRMCPLAAVQSVMYAYFTGEISTVYGHAQEVGGAIPRATLFALAINATLAFAQNISSFQTNKIAGALTMTVCANLKQVLAVLLAIIIFDVRVGLWNGVGMVVTMVGIAWYSRIELQRKGLA